MQHSFSDGGVADRTLQGRQNDASNRADSAHRRDDMTESHMLAVDSGTNPEQETRERKENEWTTHSESQPTGTHRQFPQSILQMADVLY